jgi:hypothetical protein
MANGNSEDGDYFGGMKVCSSVMDVTVRNEMKKQSPSGWRRLLRAEALAMTLSNDSPGGI